MFPRLAMVIELSKVQVGLKLNAWFQNQTSAQRKFDKISTTLLLIFWNRKSESYWSNILSWFAKYCRSHLSFSCNLIDFFNQALKFDWLCFNKAVSWLEKRCNLEHKMVRFVNKSHQFKIASHQFKITCDLKIDVIKQKIKSESHPPTQK